MAKGTGNFNLDDLFGSFMGGFGFPNPGYPGSGKQDDDSDGSNGSIPVDATVTDGDGDGGDGVEVEQGPGFFERLAQWSKRALIVLGIVGLIVLAGCYWWFHPALNIHSTQVWGWILVIAVIVAAALWVASLRHEEHAKLFRRLMVVPALALVVFVVGAVAGLSIIPGNAHRYATVLDTTEGTFADDIEEVNYAEIPVIDRDSAILLGNRAMGSIPEYVSQFEISNIYSQINYQGKPVRVSPLNYADLFKWFTNRGEGIPAYVIVDMTTQDAQVVRLGEGNGIKYSESEPLARNIDRYVQLTYPTYMFDEKAFEIDEDGTPWWVFPVQKRTIGLFSGTDIQRVVLVNACTGETQDYAIEDCPQWVDRAYPSDLIITQYNWTGLYSGGWLNSWLGQKNVMRTTPGTDGSLGYNYIAQNDDVYLYTGVSSVTADNSIIGFILVNQRTGDSRFFSVAGATEDSAMNSAEGAVQNLRYRATFPLLLNIEGEPTYFMALKDGAGLVKKYAMVNITQYQNVAVGDTVAETQASYIRLLAQQGVLSQDQASHAAATAGAQVQVMGTVETVSQVVIDGNSHFYVTLSDASLGEGADDVAGAESLVAPGAIYDFALPGLVEIVTYQAGDPIEFYVQVPEEESDSSDASAVSAEPARASLVEASSFTGMIDVVPAETTDTAEAGSEGEGEAAGDDAAAAAEAEPAEVTDVADEGAAGDESTGA